MEIRKQKEKELHNLLRDKELASLKEFEYFSSYKKWYSIIRSSDMYLENWLAKKCPNKKVLDYCCGNGGVSLRVAKWGANEVVGIDISNISIENAKKLAIKKKLIIKLNF